MENITLLNVCNELMNVVKEIRYARGVLKKRGESMADTIGSYYKKRGTTALALQNGREFVLDGEKTGKMLSTTIMPVTKGICWKEALERTLAKVEYDNAKHALESLKTEASILQSIKKHLDEV